MPVAPEPERYRMPPWFGAPRSTLPGVVAVERILAQTDKVAVCVTRLAAYPTGFEFDVLTMSADDQDDLDPLMSITTACSAERPRRSRRSSCGSAFSSPTGRRPRTPAAFTPIASRPPGRS